MIVAVVLGLVLTMLIVSIGDRPDSTAQAGAESVDAAAAPPAADAPARPVRGDR